jgi:2-keto-myo-inositol isomerase
MKLALNGATIMRSPIEQDVDIAAECGYDAIELWAAKLDVYAASASLESLAERMRDRAIAPWCINSIEDITHRDVAGRQTLMDELRRRAAMARTLGAPSIVVVPGRRDEAPSRADVVAETVDVLRAMSDVASDVELAFEFLGKPGCVVATLDLAMEIVERVGRNNVGLVIDTFHFYAGGSELPDLDRVPVDGLFVVHLNGCENLPREQLTDAHRLYPGEGVIPITSILRPLQARGFDGVASVEIFRPEYWKQDPRVVAATARDHAISVLRDAGWRVGGQQPVA